MLLSAMYHIDFLHGISDIGSAVFDQDNTKRGHVISVFFGNREIEDIWEISPRAGIDCY